MISLLPYQNLVQYTIQNYLANSAKFYIVICRLFNQFNHHQRVYICMIIIFVLNGNEPNICSSKQYPDPD